MNPVIEILKTKLNAMFKRKPGFAWAYDELYALVEIAKRPEAEAELAEIEALRKRNPDYFPFSISRLLSNWTTYIDQARNGHHIKANGSARPQGFNRNIGTANEGGASQYRLENLPKRGVVSAQKQVPGRNG